MTAKLLPQVKQRISSLVLIPSDGGRFEITVGGKLIYSKLETGEFPDENRVLKDIEAALSR